MQKGLSSGLPERTKQKTRAATAAMKIQRKSSNEADGAGGSLDNNDQESVGPGAGGSVEMDAVGVRTWAILEMVLETVQEMELVSVKET